MDYSAHYESPLGGMTMASDGESLIGLWFDGQKYFAETRRETWVEGAPDGLPIFQRTVQWLDAGYFFGLGVFETIAVEEGRPLFLDRHLARLQKGLDFLGLEQTVEPAAVRTYLKSLPAIARSRHYRV